MIVPYACSKFQNPRCSSSREIFDTNFPYALHWRDEQKDKSEKTSKEILALWFSFTQDTSTLCRSIQNLKTLALLGAEKSVTKNFIGEKDK